EPPPTGLPLGLDVRRTPGVHPVANLAEPVLELRQRLRERAARQTRAGHRPGEGGPCAFERGQEVIEGPRGRLEVLRQASATQAHEPTCSASTASAILGSLDATASNPRASSIRTLSGSSPVHAPRRRPAACTSSTNDGPAGIEARVPGRTMSCPAEAA